MLPALLVVALVVAVLAFVVLLDRRDRRERDERQILLTRIQAPAIAVAQSLDLPDAEPVRALPFDDDDAFWAYKNGEAT
jgi:ABC-type Co2+ transport system permease subunit